MYMRRHPDLGLERSEIIVTLANMVYGALQKRNLWAYSKSQIYQVTRRTSFGDDHEHFFQVSTVGDIPPCVDISSKLMHVVLSFVQGLEAGPFLVWD